MNIFGEIVWLFFFDKNKLFYSRRKEFKIISIYYAVLFFIFIVNKITPKLYSFSPVLTRSHICIKCTMNYIIIIILICFSELQNSFLAVADLKRMWPLIFDSPFLKVYLNSYKLDLF